MFNEGKKPELLAPAGSLESLKAAVQNGCDAVYLGGKAFGARAYAANFSRDELCYALDYAHLYGVKVYVTVNTLYKDEELDVLLKFVGDLYADGVDAIILQDIGVAQLFQQVFPELELHASTQMTVHNVEGARYLAELGFKRVVLARELNLTEIKEIVKNVPIEVETFIHGALCICYSGQCLMSSLIGGRSGNRGRCAQPCRLPYELLDRDFEEILGLAVEPEHLLSPKDICTLEILPELIEVGIASFKIEGRLKRPEYTASVTRIYHKYLDLAVKNSGKFKVDTKDVEELEQIFNRGGFTPGYYREKTGSMMMSYGRPKNWGIHIGEVCAYDQRRGICQVRLSGLLNEGDGIEIWTGMEDNPGTIVSSLKVVDGIASFPIKGAISKGDQVYRTSKKKLLDELTASYSEYRRKINLFGHVSLKVGERALLSIWDNDGNYAQVTGEELITKADKQPVTHEKVVEQIGKLGNLPFHLVDLAIEMKENIFMPISKLNSLRRKAVEQLQTERLKLYQREQKNLDIQQLLSVPTAKERVENPKLAVYLHGKFEAEKFIKLGIKRLYLNLVGLTVEQIQELRKISENQVEIFAVLPRIAHNQEMERVAKQIKKLDRAPLNGFLAGNLGEVELLIKLQKPMVVDFFLNTFNKLTMDHWRKAGARGVTVSPELNLRELAELLQWVEIPKEVIVYGHLPSMVSKYCPVGALAGGFGVNQRCSRPSGNFGLRDRLGHVFPVLTNCQDCRSTILNPQALFLLEELGQICKAGFTVLRMDLTIENQEEAITLVKAYLERLTYPQKKLTREMEQLIEMMQCRGFTRGHFYRGVE